MRENYLELLGVSKLATESEIRDAYLNLLEQNDNPEFEQVLEEAYFCLTNSNGMKYVHWIMEGEVWKEPDINLSWEENKYPLEKDDHTESWIDTAKQQVGVLAQRLKIVYT